MDNSEKLIGDLVDGLEPGTMVTKYVVVAEGVDVDGNRALYTTTNPGATIWDSAGLIWTALKREEAAIFAAKLNGPGDEIL